MTDLSRFDMAPSDPSAPKGRFAAHLAGASGRDLHLAGHWRPMIGLGEAALRGHVLHVEVRERAGGLSPKPVDIAALNPVDAERLDLTAAEHGFEALDAAPAGDHPPVAVLTLSWQAVRSSRTRRKILQCAADAQVRLRVLPVCEICGLEDGTPPSVIRETVGLLQPIFRGVLAKVSPRKALTARLADCGLTGAAVEAGDLAESADAQAMLRTVLSLQRVGPSVLLHSLRSVAALAAARTAGARWASLDVVRSGWRGPGAALRALAQDPA